MRKLAILLVLQIFVLGFLIVPKKIAQSEMSVAINQEIVGSEIYEGMIVATDGVNVFLADKEYEPNVIGVITSNPAITLGENEGSGNYPISTTGNIPVLIKKTDAKPKKGDYITASNIPGVGMIASNPGWVIGTVISDVEDQFDSYDTVMVSLKIEYGDGNNPITKAYKYSMGFLDQNSFIQFIKLIMAGLIAIITFLGATNYYTQISKTEVEALGRNPLASKIIQRNSFLHLVILILICVVGIGMATAVILL